MTAEILQAYAIIGRSRQYVGMMGAPAPIGQAAIGDYLGRYPSAINREEFDSAIFALDDDFRKSWEAQQEADKPATAKKR